MFGLLLRILFLFPPERAHALAMSMLRLALSVPVLGSVLKKAWKPDSKPIHCMGLEFPNAVGLAAGFDKDAKHLDVFEALGFGFVEVGTVTPKPQSGNPKPRLFRLVKDRALINRMGFNNEGMEAMAARLKQRKPEKLIVGVNIGKNKDTPNEQALDDYLNCFHRLYALSDYIVVNVSSPNTPGLRALQDKEPLSKIMQALMESRAKMMEEGAGRKPLLLKIAPDLNESQLDDVAALSLETGIDGLVVSNTTLSREGLSVDEKTIHAIGNGGLSGAPLTDKAQSILEYLSQRLPSGFPIIGVGGIMNVEDAAKRKQAGAVLIQLYTGFIYGGPALVKRIATQWALPRNNQSGYGNRKP
ncbi:MAG: quinone-dependent dihydroorotate dehydrogenase [Bacteroidetes bacterium]|nr:quinone-dependent dihydroorotate dehydrogenase [Bacteroidota bacterium]